MRELVGFEREPHQPSISLLETQVREDVRCFHQFQFQRDSRLGQFPGKTFAGPVIADCGCRNRSLAIDEQPAANVVQFFGRFDLMDFATWWRSQRNGPTDQNGMMSSSQDGFDDRIAHATAAGIRQIPDIVKIFARRTGGDENSHRK